MLKSHFIHELQTSNVLRLQGFHERCAQVFHALGVAFGGVDTLFFRRQSSLCTARPTADRLTAGAPAA
ncbi:hypothetical protein, partial [Hymenobacter sp. UV11]|uniref:hypothetical protein n=1 Tax=Hymenobacter sp. UV11 TaxID=1849735 RepID=UPI001C2C41A4